MHSPFNVSVLGQLTDNLSGNFRVVSHAQMACLEMQLEDEWRSELEEELLELQKQRAVQVTKYAYMYAR